MKLSVVIAMYNAESCINKCLDSIISADFPKDDYEICVVDDGSTDQSKNIVELYKDKANIIYIYQENQGQSVARNTGLKHVQGDYVWFVDSDDMIYPDAKKIFEILSLYPRLDVLRIDVFQMNQAGELGSERVRLDKIPVQKEYVGRDLLLLGYVPSAMWFLVVRRNFLIDNSLYFIPGILHEDVELSLRILTKAKSVYLSSVIGYIYWAHTGSSTRTKSEEKWVKNQLDQLVVLEAARRLVEEYEFTDKSLYENIKARYHKMYFGFIYFIYQQRKLHRKSVKVILKEMESYSLYPLIIEFGSLKKDLFALWLNQKLAWKL